MIIAASAGLSGILNSLAFPPFCMSHIIWVVLIPLLVVTPYVKIKAAFLAGFLTGLVLSVIDLGWMFGIFGLFAIPLLAIVAAFYGVALALYLWMHNNMGKGLALAALPFIWVALEYFRSEVWFLRFSWLALGYSQHCDPRTLQLASIAGVYGLSFSIVAINSMLVYALSGECVRGRIASIILAVAIPVSFLFAGATMVVEPVGNIPVTGIQIENGEPASVKELMERAMRQYPDTKILVLPEWTFHIDMSETSYVMKEMKEFSERNHLLLIFGAREHAPEGDSPNDFRNTAFIIDDGRLIHKQCKSQPVQFFIDGLPAEKRNAFNSRFGRIGAAICYDMDYTFVSNDLVYDGAEILIYPTEDCLDWGRMQHILHASIAPLRAVENHRWLFRVATSGISEIVDPHGRIVRSAGSESDFINGKIGKSSTLTFFSKYGKYFPHFCCGVAAAAVILLILKSLKPKQP